jgi:hypothetical protein
MKPGNPSYDWKVPIPAGAILGDKKRKLLRPLLIRRGLFVANSQQEEKKK